MWRFKATGFSAKFPGGLPAEGALTAALRPLCRPAEEGGGALDYTFIEVRGGLGKGVMRGILGFLESCHSKHFFYDRCK